VTYYYFDLFFVCKLVGISHPFETLGYCQYYFECKEEVTYVDDFRKLYMMIFQTNNGKGISDHVILLVSGIILYI
jgi:hypothetical protein